MKPPSPYCPTCHRRLHKLQAAPKHKCLACGQPVESLGVGRPRLLHPECRNLRRKTLERPKGREARP